MSPIPNQMVLRETSQKRVVGNKRNGILLSPCRESIGEIAFSWNAVSSELSILLHQHLKKTRTMSNDVFLSFRSWFSWLRDHPDNVARFSALRELYIGIRLTRKGHNTHGCSIVNALKPFWGSDPRTNSESPRLSFFVLVDFSFFCLVFDVLQWITTCLKLSECLESTASAEQWDCKYFPLFLSEIGFQVSDNGRLKIFKMQAFKLVKSSKSKFKQVNRGHQQQVKSTESLKKKLQNFQFSGPSSSSQSGPAAIGSKAMQVQASCHNLRDMSDQEVDGWETDGESVNLEATIANEGTGWANNSSQSSVIHDKSTQ